LSNKYTDVICSGKKPKHNIVGRYPLNMAKDSDWTISDLTDMKNQDFPHEVKIARELLEIMNNIEKTDLDIRIPRASIEFIENTLSDYFEIIGEIEKKRGNLPYLIDRELYFANQGNRGAPSWNQGLTLEDISTWLGEWGGSQMGDYPFMQMNDVTKSDEPLSGYYNRLFPVKFVMRIFTILILNSEAYDKENGWDPAMELDDQVSLSHLRGKSAQTAKYAREWLKKIDVDSGSERGAEYSTGFPEDEKSRERFVAQFVGSKRKNKLSGAIFDLGFANIRSFMGMMNADDLYMTHQGWTFATLENPLLDSMDGWLKGIRFSEQESKFLLKHFEKNIPGEWKFLKEVVSLIHSGTNKPKTLENALIKSRGWEKAHASIMKNGVLSRMQEMNLIGREKDGRNVTYHLTEKGLELLSE